MAGATTPSWPRSTRRAAALTYFTYLGGAGGDAGDGIALDTTGNAYVTGGTTSSDLAYCGAYQTTYGGGDYDTFVAKVNSTGSGLAYFHLPRREPLDVGNGIAVDTIGNAYLTGYTASSGLATLGAYQMTFGGDYDAFVAKVTRRAAR